MKKFLFLTLIFSGLVSASTYAQASASQGTGNQPAANAAPVDHAAMLQQAKEKQAPLLVEKTGLTLAQANRVIEINYETRLAAMGLRDLNEADRATKIAELKAAKEKKYSEIPLTPEQIKTVYAYYEEMGKNRQQKTHN